MKRCCVCGEEKSLSEFHRSKARRDGHVGKCKPCACAAARESGQRIGYKPAKRLARYGLTPEQYEKILEDQDGKCAICYTDLPSPHVDHSHNTGVVRGLLCSSCNIGLGMFCDDPIRLEAAIHYLTASMAKV